MANNFILVTDEELENLLDCDAENTNKVTKYALNRLESFAKCTGLDSLEDVNRLHEDEFDKHLCKFHTFANHFTIKLRRVI